MIDDMQVYIANLGKYNEGELVGDWFSFPLDEEVIAERIGLNAEYEEYAFKPIRSAITSSSNGKENQSPTSSPSLYLPRLAI